MSGYRNCLGVPASMSSAPTYRIHQSIPLICSLQRLVLRNLQNNEQVCLYRQVCPGHKCHSIIQSLSQYKPMRGRVPPSKACFCPRVITLPILHGYGILAATKQLPNSYLPASGTQCTSALLQSFPEEPAFAPSRLEGRLSSIQSVC